MFQHLIPEKGHKFYYNIIDKRKPYKVQNAAHFRIEKFGLSLNDGSSFFLLNKKTLDTKLKWEIWKDFRGARD